MCMIDGADRCEVWNQTTPRARKAHKCDECYRPIAPGERYTSIFTVSEGDPSTFRMCAHCAVLARWLQYECSGYCIYGVLEDFGEHADEYRRFDLAMLRARARKKWTRKDGSLMAIPSLPYTSEAIAAQEAGRDVSRNYRTHRYEPVDEEGREGR